MIELPPLEAIDGLLSYDPASGVLRWKVDRGRYGGAAKAGDIAGCVDGNGYVLVQIGPKKYKAHRIAWLLSHGSWPVDQIDHINGIRNDNRLANLREATNAQNNQNRKGANRNNMSSGVIGVSWHKQLRKWQASIRINGRQRTLGVFTSIEDASAAYQKAKSELHEFAARKA